MPSGGRTGEGVRGREQAMFSGGGTKEGNGSRDIDVWTAAKTEKGDGSRGDDVRHQNRRWTTRAGAIMPRLLSLFSEKFRLRRGYFDFWC